MKCLRVSWVSKLLLHLVEIQSACLEERRPESIRSEHCSAESVYALGTALVLEFRYLDLQLGSVLCLTNWFLHLMLKWLLISDGGETLC